MFVFCVSVTVRAQSTNIDFPTPIVANEISGTIEPRDLGDPRLTRHFFYLTGTPGDLYLSVESSNLNGAVDLFTASGLRPLTKLSIFAGISTTSTTKSVYLRRSETLIVRVEARSASDEAGNYKIRLTGSFEPIADVGDSPENIEPVVTSQRGKNTRRVNAAGALIKEDEPVASVTTPAVEKSSDPLVEEKKAEKESEPASESEPPKTTPVKKTRPAKAKPAPRNTRKKSTTTAKKKVEPATATTSTAETVPPPTPAEPEQNPRLIIETRDGMRVERYMSEVRRVTVERGQLIVITKDGKVERRPMSSILRMAIEP